MSSDDSATDLSYEDSHSCDKCEFLSNDDTYVKVDIEINLPTQNENFATESIKHENSPLDDKNSETDTPAYSQDKSSEANVEEELPQPRDPEKQGDSSTPDVPVDPDPPQESTRPDTNNEREDLDESESAQDKYHGVEFWRPIFYKWFLKEADITEKTATDPRTYEPEFQLFMDQRIFDLRISYTYSILAFHLIICYYFISNLLTCPQYPPHITSFETISNYTVQAPTHTWAWNLPKSSITTCLYPTTFVHFTWYIQCIFYTTLLVSRYTIPSLERKILVYFPYMINGMVWSSYYLISRAQKPTALFFSHAENQYPTVTYNWSYLRHGTLWNIWIPIFIWWVYLVLRRGAMGLYMWEFETLLHNWAVKRVIDDGKIVDETEDEFDQRKILYARLNLVWFRVYCLLSPCLVLVVWYLWVRTNAVGPRVLVYVFNVLVPFFEIFRRMVVDVLGFTYLSTLSITKLDIPNTRSLFATDMAKFPGIVWTLLLVVIAGAPMVLWYSFLTFQIQVVTWSKRYKHGFAILAWEKDVKVGIIY
ncbi:hypothetical protein HK098_002273 [Nowakowskiella sp. JEL0407]|nr:hypothetical protein HK098_002273 [Nowakowskiella sp. JEL0407]